jgi:hypothetical protein
MPPNTIYVGRPTRWGNLHPVGKVCPECSFKEPVIHSRKEAIEQYRLDIHRIFDGYKHELLEEFLAPLRGKDLVCWCPLDKPCHADILLELANKKEGWRFE